MPEAATAPVTRGHKKKQRTRSQLIAAAMEVISTRGEVFSIGDVTSRAGVSHGTFYNYFDDRDALIAAVIPEAITAFAVESEALVDEADPVMRFAMITSLALRRSAVDPDRFRPLVQLDAVQRAIVEATSMDSLRGDLAAGFAAGRFVVGPDPATVDSAVGAMIFAIRRIVDEAVSDDYSASVVAQLLRSLGLPADEAAAIAGRSQTAAIALTESD